jgi:3-hydroxyacyl-[acyl-carrier-protein] dehydratase
MLRGPQRQDNGMPPSHLFDISKINLDALAFDQEAIRQCNPQRGDMEHLNGIVWFDEAAGLMLGYKDVRPDEFWVPGHIPGRPLLPGVIMLEAAAQLSSFYTKKCLKLKGFLGFGAVENCKFRLSVAPGCRLYLLARLDWHRHRRVCSTVQGLVQGNIAFETQIIGTEM